MSGLWDAFIEWQDSISVDAWTDHAEFVVAMLLVLLVWAVLRLGRALIRTFWGE